MDLLTQRGALVITLFERGGVLMYPLTFFSILALWIFLERSYHLRRANGRAGDLFDTIRDYLLTHDYQKAYQVTRQYRGPVAAVCRVLLQHPMESKDNLEEIATMQARQERKRLMARLPLLGLIGALSPLVGLLGTVLGMVKAFQQVADAQGAVNPSLLAGGIWEALLTTVVGLFVAIPTLFFYHYLDQRVKNLTFDMEHYGTALIRLLITTEHSNA
jgi:biopolymer transport protein ExbB